MGEIDEQGFRHLSGYRFAAFTIQCTAFAVVSYTTFPNMFGVAVAMLYAVGTRLRDHVGAPS